jgi:signal transduction histidine kinase
MRGQQRAGSMQFLATAKYQSFPARCVQMLFEDRPLVFRYILSCLVVAAASLLAALLPARVDPSHFTLFFLAVMLSTWYGGAGAGLMATVLSALALDYFFISPIHSIELDSHALVRLCVFLIVSVITYYLTNARRQAEAGLRRAHAELEDRVRERTAELARTNEALRAEITERVKAERESLRLQLEMGRVERLATLGRMAGTIAHDLGTPLNSVLGYAQLLSQEQLPERARRRLTIIETQINRMEEIIHRYLSQTRGSPLRDKIEVNDLVRDTVILLQPMFEQLSLAVTTRLDTALPVLHGDATSIQRVLVNLIDNAVDACEKGGRIEIRTLGTPATANKGPGITIEIADNGAGISPEILPRIFEMFVTTKPSGKGTGLGLAVCQEIVKAHGGTINISTGIEQGTTVSVYLPADVKPERSRQTEERDECANTDRG